MALATSSPTPPQPSAQTSRPKESSLATKASLVPAPGLPCGGEVVAAAGPERKLAVPVKLPVT